MTDQTREEISDFLKSRRLAVAPTAAELGLDARPRRVSGLRREEVARRAAISLDYYIQLERGRVRGVSDSVLASLMDALELDDVERRYLTDLIAQLTHRPVSAATPVAVSPELRQTLSHIEPVAATVRDHRMTMLHANRVGSALFRHVLELEDRNIARHVFLDPRSRALYPDHDEIADHAAGTLRVSLAAHPGDAELPSLVDDLMASQDFRDRWHTHRVLRTGPGLQIFQDEHVGRLVLHREQFEVLDGSRLVVNLFRPADDGDWDRFKALAGLAPETEQEEGGWQPPV